MCKLLDGRAWQWEKLGLALVGRALFSKTLIQLSADGWGCTLLVVWPEATHPWGLGLYGRLNGDLLEGVCQRGPSRTVAASGPFPVVSPC